MGRLPTPQKPPGSSRDPAESARVAAIKQAIAANDSRHTAFAPAPAPPVSSDLTKRLDNLNKDDLRNALINVLETHVDARATFQAFCDTPVGAETKPYDFSGFYSRCSDAMAEVGSEDWEYNHRYESLSHERTMQVRRVTEPIESVYEEIKDVCTKPSFSGAAKLGGMKTLLDIVILVDEAGDLNDDDMSSEDRHDELKAGAFEAMEAICKTVATEERRELYNSEAFKEFLTDCEHYGSEAATATALIQEIEDQLADCEEEEEEETSDEDDDEFDSDGYDEDGMHREEDAKLRAKFGEDYRLYR